MEGTVSEQKKEYVALLLTMVLALWLFLESLYWVTMAHQVLEACLQCKPQQGACHKTVETTQQVLIDGDFWEWWKLSDLIQNFE